MSKYSGCVLDVARQRGGATPSIVTLDDLSRYKNDGAMTDVSWVQLPSGLWVMSFDGTDCRVVCPNTITIGTSDFTIEVWARCTQLPTVAVSNQGLITADGVGAGLTVFYYVESNNRFRVHMNGTGRSGTLTAALDLNAWVLYTTTFDRSGNATLYKSATLYDTIDISAEVAVSLTAPTPTLGDVGWAVGVGEFFGDMALARIYKYLLTPAQIRARYSATRRLFGV